MGKIPGQSFTNARGQKLHTYAYVPDDGNVKAVLFWHHGLGDYMDRMDESAQAFANAGIAVYGFDAHGMGRSEPLDERERCFIQRFSHLVDDAVTYISEVLQPAIAASGITAPVFMGGGSLGGLVAAYTVLERPDFFAGLILLAPALDVEWNWILRIQAALGNLLAALVPRAKLVPAVRPQDMSQDPAVVKAFLEDPLMYKGNARALTGNEILKAFRALAGRRKEFALPTLGVHGTSDRCTSLPALRKHLQHMSSKDVTLTEIEGGYHDLLHGPEKEEVWAIVSDWVRARADAAPAAAPKEGPEASGVEASHVNVSA